MMLNGQIQARIGKDGRALGISDTKQWLFYINSSYMPHER
jgi:hypothetical protein